MGNTKWRGGSSSAESQEIDRLQPLVPEPAEPPEAPTALYADAPAELNFITLQNNLQNCLEIIDGEVMKGYVPTLQHCQVIPLDGSVAAAQQQIQFFRITELVYQEDEFSVHKLSTVFSALSNKPCTLVLMIQSDGQTNNFYLGVRSRDPQYSTGTMRQMLEQSLLGLFPGSNTTSYYSEDLQANLRDLSTGCVSSVTCIADYKEDGVRNKDYIQGLEKFIYSMQGKAFTAICIANNLTYHDLVETRKEYERIYTLMSPFANMQYNYTLNSGSSSSISDTHGQSETDSIGENDGISTNKTHAVGATTGETVTQTETETEGTNQSETTGQNHGTTVTDGTNDSTTITKTLGGFASTGVSTGVNVSGNAGVSFFASAGASIGASVSTNKNIGISASVSRGTTHGTSHSASVSDSISQSLTQGTNHAKSTGVSKGTNRSTNETESVGTGTQHGWNTSHSLSTNSAQTLALTETLGNSQAVTLNVQNKSLLNTLERLEKQMARLNECESVGMWDFAAYFLGESAAETETAASMYRSLVSGSQSGLECTAVNTWTDSPRVDKISKYVTNFLHPVFLYQSGDGMRQTVVDATVLASTNELAIQLGLPRKSVKGLPVIEHATFAQEVINHTPREEQQNIVLGNIAHLGRDTGTSVELDLQSLSMHTFVTGSTGAGKSNTVYCLLAQMLQHNVSFLVVEPAKGEYKNIFGHRKDVSVYGTNPLLTKLLRINPFSFPKEIHIYEHLDRLVEIFNVCWPMYAAMPAILKDAMERAYVKAGWDLRKSQNRYADHLFPNFVDVLQQIDAVMEQSQYSSDNKGDYKGALCTRLRSLTNGINGLVFTSNELSPQELFDQSAIIDLSRVGSTETKSLIMGLLVMKLQEYRMACFTGMNVPLKHVTVLEEAHNLLKRTSTEQNAEGANLLGKSVEMLTNAIAEMRTYGEGFIIADQSPGLLDMSVIRNTNTKIIMRLPEYSDRTLVGRAAGLNEEQITELSKLDKGVASVYQNNWQEAVLCKVKKYDNGEQIYRAEQLEDLTGRSIKGEIIRRIIKKDIYHLADWDKQDILIADMPAAAKCSLLDYIQTPDTKKLDAAAAVAYELFSAEAAFAALVKTPCNYEQQRRYLIDHLTPSIAPFPEDCRQAILYLVTYRSAQITADPGIRIFMQQLLDEQPGKEVL